MAMGVEGVFGYVGERHVVFLLRTQLEIGQGKGPQRDLEGGGRAGKELEPVVRYGRELGKGRWTLGRWASRG